MPPVKIQTSDGLHPIVNDSIIDFQSSLLVGDRAKLLLHDEVYRLTTRISLMRDGLSAQIIETPLFVKRRTYVLSGVKIKLTSEQIEKIEAMYTTEGVTLSLEDKRNTLTVKLQNIRDIFNTTLRDSFFKPLVTLLTMDFLKPVLKSTAKIVRKFKSRMIR